MSLVLDCSTTVAWCFEDERTPAVLDILRRVVAEGANVPVIWRYEVPNVLLVAERRRRLDAAGRHLFMGKVSDLDIRVNQDADRHLWTSTLRLAERHRLTVYDASYLELAQRARVPLSTLDKSLAEAALAEGVELA